MAYKESITQPDLTGALHPPQFVIDKDKLISFAVAVFDPENGLEQVGFYEFDGFKSLSSGLLGLDIALEPDTSFAMAYIPHPALAPNADIYMLRGNTDSPLEVFKQQSLRHSRRCLKDLEKMFFSFLYSNQRNPHYRSLSSSEVNSLANSPPFNAISSCIYSLNN